MRIEVNASLILFFGYIGFAESENRQDPYSRGSHNRPGSISAYRNSQRTIYQNCNIEDYYAAIGGLPGLYDKELLTDLIQTSHVNQLPYTSSTSLDVWDALIEIDSPDGGQNVNLVYRDITFPAMPFGTTDTWNREHVWPKSLGVGESGKDYTDVHSLKPADWNVNSARNNRYFSACGIANDNTDCTSPAHAEAAIDTERDLESFLPPANSRGDVARSILYMAFRYDGSEDFTTNLTITDCPSETATENEMAYLSQLLEWHEADPPTAEEIARNQLVCENWQGNRNPFIDYPELVAYYYGLPREPLGEGLGYNCTEPNPQGPDAPSFDDGTCADLSQGDIMFLGFTATNPDVMVFVALAYIPGGIPIHVTDMNWQNNLRAFDGLEGIVTLVTPPGGIAAGKIFGYGMTTLTYSSLWEVTDYGFHLTMGSEAIFVYCVDDAEDDDFVFITAMSYHYDDVRKYIIPPELATYTKVPHQDNYKYVGPRMGTKETLIQELMNISNWEGSYARINDLDTQDPFTILQ